MGTDENEVTVIGKQTIPLPLMAKSALARKLMAIIATEYYANKGQNI
jgi:hypothetical protein